MADLPDLQLEDGYDPNDQYEQQLPHVADNMYSLPAESTFQGVPTSNQRNFYDRPMEGSPRYSHLNGSIGHIPAFPAHNQQNWDNDAMQSSQRYDHPSGGTRNIPAFSTYIHHNWNTHTNQTNPAYGIPADGPTRAGVVSSINSHSATDPRPFPFPNTQTSENHMMRAIPQHSPPSAFHTRGGIGNINGHHSIRDTPALTSNHYQAPENPMMQAASKRKRTKDTEDDEVTSKKRRVTQACDQCSETHYACKGGLPRCTRCIEKGLECTWNKPKVPRGPKKGVKNEVMRWIGQVCLSNPDVIESLKNELMNGRHPKTGKSNVECINDASQFAEQEKAFGSSSLAAFMGHYTSLKATKGKRPSSVGKHDGGVVDAGKERGDHEQLEEEDEDD
ncbi:hypothetical protein F4778DRAFT_802744 [Xylariomycetidae sp. FL2044]|nr:hypothetical protein F4778DRAFT_802744 [Xylariomycetidae sp. FL2044]